MIPLSDFKQIVKESLRDAFYTNKESLNEILVGKKISIEVYGQLGKYGTPYLPYAKYPAVLSKNTIPTEKPYRLTWFNEEDREGHNEPLGHIDMNISQFNKLMDGIPDENVYNKLSQYIEAERIHVNLEGEADEEDDDETSLVAETTTNKNDLLLLLEESSREIDLWLENRTIVETMDLYVKGADYNRYDTLGRICSHVLNRVFYAMSQMPEDQQEYWKKNHMFPTYEMIVPDGNYFDEPIGIINFYISGMTQQMLRLALKTIFKEFKTLGLKWGKVKTEQSKAYPKSSVIRIPITENNHVGQYKGPIELNMANRNAYHIFKNVLQFEPEDESGSSFSFTSDELLERIEALAKDQGWIDKHAINPTDSDWPEDERDEQDFENPHDEFMKQIAGGLGGPRMIGSGLSGDDIRHRIRIIWQIAKWAKEHGYKELYVA